jgi:hypothetical protein
MKAAMLSLKMSLRGTKQSPQKRGIASPHRPAVGAGKSGSQWHSAIDRKKYPLRSLVKNGKINAGTHD